MSRITQLNSNKCGHFNTYTFSLDKERKKKEREEKIFEPLLVTSIIFVKLSTERMKKKKTSNPVISYVNMNKYSSYDD
jgi:hypothetical protein